MDWVQKPGINVSAETKPRHLTDDEITAIIEVTPDVASLDKIASRQARSDILDWLRTELRAVQLTPAGVQEMKNNIVRMFETSRVEPYTSVGITTAEALGAIITQMSLNSFHTSGSAQSVSVGFLAVQELIYARKNRKKEITHIHFTDKTMTYVDVLNKRIDLVEVLVARVIKDYEIESNDRLEQFWWHKSFAKIMKKKFIVSSKVLRLILDIDAMYTYRITMKELADTIESDRSTVCVYGSIFDGIMDVYLDEATIKEKLRTKSYLSADPELNTQLYFKQFLLPLFDTSQAHIKGVPGIKTLIPLVLPVWQVVISERKATLAEIENYDLQGNGIWVMRLDTNKMNITGINLDILVDYIEEGGIEFIGVSEEKDTLFVRLQGNVRPGEYLSSQLENEKKTNEGKKIEEDKVYTLQNASQIVRADANGRNLVELLARNDIDKERTISNNIHEISQVLGLEAAMAYFVKDLNNVVLSSESYVNPRHIQLIASFVFGRGVPLGVTFSGVARNNVGVVAEMSYERSFERAGLAANFGNVGDIRNVSTSIAIGERPFIGKIGR